MESVCKFVDQWAGHGYEKGDTHTFWLQFLRDVLNVAEPEKYIKFEVPVKLKHTSFIDAFFPDSKVIIEQKSLKENLEQGKSQSDGSTLTPYEQAQRYGSSLPYSMRPRWIIVSNFKQFLIYDMETLTAPTKILLEELPEKFHVFNFLIDSTENKIHIELDLSLKAGEIVGKLYDALHSQYINPENTESLQSLNKLCVRLVFCLYAESAGIFSKHKIFRDYLQVSRNIRQDLILLFEVLNTPIDKRDPYLADELKIFPYVNGGLFDGFIEIPNFTSEIKNLLLDEASGNFNWSGISPTIFGAVFESTLNPVTRRAGGMHYTSIENIHKVIDPLFLDELTDEFKQIISSPVKSRKKILLDFQNKLAALKFFDPACGSGNFLTESFICLRRLENNILRELFGAQIQLGEFNNPVKVSIQQFYGVEINDFACTVARTALWIAELQMIKETMEIIHRDLDFLPLKSYVNIIEGNALSLDWKNILPSDVNFIMGNPPFVGASMMNATQKNDAVNIFGKIKLSNSIDYVGAWYHIAAKFMTGTKIKTAFVSTNSITQGEQVAPLWKKIFENYGMQIIFAHKTFRWDSESTQKAAVHCVIIAFADKSLSIIKKIFDGDNIQIVKNISPYLIDAENILIESRSKPICDVPKMTHGNKPTDDGNFIFSEEEANAFCRKYPEHAHLLHRYIGGKDFLHGVPIRFCLWLKDIPPNEFSGNKEIMRRLNNIKIFREKSSAAPTRKAADTPYKFFSTPQTNSNYIALPSTSSERRKYLPIKFLTAEVIPNSDLCIIPDATLFHFGVLISSVHMAWIKTVAGRLKSDFRYSASVVYNNFVWCQPTDKQKRAIELTAQKILDVRKNYPDATLADLYDPLTMPKDLRDAHKENDAAVLTAYGFDLKMSESEIARRLMQLYEVAAN